MSVANIFLKKNIIRKENIYERREYTNVSEYNIFSLRIIINNKQ